jgi:type III restriction enzyme
LRLHSQTLLIEQHAHTERKLQSALAVARQRTHAHWSTGNFENLQAQSSDLNTLGEAAEFADWLVTICLESAGSIKRASLQAWLESLQAIFEALTEIDPRGQLSTTVAQPLRRYQNLASQTEVRSLIRMAFWPLRRYDSTVEALPESAQLLLLQANCLPTHTPAHDKLYPSAEQVEKILQADARGQRGHVMAQTEAADTERARQLLLAQGLGQFAATLPSGAAPVPAFGKDQSFHYLPYDFAQSGLELGLLDELLKFEEFRASGLEIYYNGARHLTEFRIECFHQHSAGRWQRMGYYTPDFLLLSRHPQSSEQAGQAKQVLIIEAKGKGFAEQSDYTRRRDFVQQHFVPMNNQKFDFQRFDFIQIDEPEKKDYKQSAQRLRQHAERFFGIAC